MSAKSFKFISPGIFLNEIDNSQLPAEPKEIGPLVIGRTTRGPAMRPVIVDSFEEFVKIYGTPAAGTKTDDTWRNGEPISPTYASYAAQAWLKNSPTITVLRLAGKHHQYKTSTTTVAAAGWRTDNNYDKDVVLPTISSSYTDHRPSTTASVPMPGVLIGNNVTTTNTSSGGGAFGLWVFDSKITGAWDITGAPQNALSMASTGCLAAIWYVNGPGTVGLKGQATFPASGSGGGNSGSVANREFAQAEFIASDASGIFTVKITGSSTTYNREIGLSLTEGSKNYIREVFNTDPSLVNTSITPATPTDAREIYWLGETYTNELTRVSSSLTASIGAASGQANLDNTYWGIILKLANNPGTGHSNVKVDHSIRKRQFTDAETGWYFSQDVSSATGSYDPLDMQKLFKFVGLGHGPWLQTHVKVTIDNVRKPDNEYIKYGSFDVVLRSVTDTDQSKIIIERFSNCNLDPSSPDFVGNKIGTQYYQFDATKRRLVLKGAFPNRSKYIRVKFNASVESGQTNKDFLPFGVFGPIKYRDFHWQQGSDQVQQCLTSSLSALSAGVISCSLEPSQHVVGMGNTRTGVAGADLPTTGIVSLWGRVNAYNGAIVSTAYDVKALHATVATGPGTRYKFEYPRVALRANSDQDNLPVYTEADWGVWTGKSTSNTNYNQDISDLARPPSSMIASFHDPASTNAYLEHQYAFTLDDIYYDSGSTVNRYAYQSGRRRLGTSTTAISGVAAVLSSSIAVNSFTTLFYGGTDGWDITEMDPTRNSLIDGTTETTNYAYNTIKEAIDSVKDPEFAEYNLINIPNLTANSLTNHLLSTVESRADALAIIDLEGDFQPTAEGANISDGGGVKLGDVNNTVQNLKDRGLNNSYGCAYYPYVQVRDTLTNELVYMPPSVVALGAMSYTDRVKAPWFAPAGFNRGGLSTGLAGLPVFGVTDKLTSKERDKLYEANINPIASFPNEGIVVFGQKTLQVTRSSLDRINVRRLLIFVKKGISRISKDILFEPNVQETWDRFISRAEPFLADVKARFGVTDYKLVLDKTTTTPALIDQNIMYAKIFLKPTRAIEFIAVDFVITNTGAAFED